MLSLLASCPFVSAKLGFCLPPMLVPKRKSSCWSERGNRSWLVRTHQHPVPKDEALPAREASSHGVRQVHQKAEVHIWLMFLGEAICKLLVWRSSVLVPRAFASSSQTSEAVHNGRDVILC